MAALLTEGVSSSAEGELAIDETASTVSIAPNVCVVPEMSVAVPDGEESVQDFLDHLRGEESAARHFVLGGEADYNDSFVGIMNGITAVGDAESESWTFVDVPFASPALGPPGPSKIRSSPSKRKKSLGAPWSCRGNLRFPVLRLVPRGDHW